MKGQDKHPAGVAGNTTFTQRKCLDIMVLLHGLREE
jgi:hypothetical protein